MTIELSALAIGELLGDGGFGVVHRVAGHPVSQDPRPMVLKRPKPGLDPVHVPSVLEGMRYAVRFRHGLSERDRQRIDEIAVWPVAMVTDRGREVGCLLPLIPQEFFIDIQPTNNIPGDRKVRGYEYLTAPAQSRQNLGYDDPDYEDELLRLLLLAKLAGAIELLHSHDLVFGDLNPHNEVFTFSPPAALLLDCDAVGHVGDPKRVDRQGHFPRWTPPEMIEQGPAASSGPRKLQNFETDVYKLGLAFVRFIRGEKGATQRLAFPHPLSSGITPELALLVSRALDPDPDLRPSAADLRRAAEAAVSTLMAPPKILRAEMSRRVALRGQDVIVSWAIDSATPFEIEILGPAEQTTKPHPGSSNATVRVLHAGSVSLTVRTRYASVTHDLGEIDCYELPQFNVAPGVLPMPIIPELTPFVASRALTRPRQLPVPSLGAPIHDLSDGLHRLAGTAPSLEGWGFASVDAIGSLSAARIGPEIVGAFPLPDAVSLGRPLLAILERQLEAVNSTSAISEAQTSAYLRTIRELSERVAELEAGRP